MPTKNKSLLTNPTLYVCGLVMLYYLLPSVTLAKNNVITDAFGVNIHLRQRHVEEDWSEVLTMASDAGVQWGREQFNWDVIEPSDDSYNFETYDAVVDAYETAGIEMVGLLTYSSSWASDNPGATDYEFYPPDLDAWSNYVETVTQRYAGRVTYWEIWNEPNHDSFWTGDEGDYADLLDSAIAAAKQGNPDAKIIFGGLSGSDYTFLETVLPLLDDTSEIDVMAIHPYRTSNDNLNYGPEATASGLNTLPIDLYNVKAVLNRFEMATVPLWLTEVGWQTGDDGVSNRRQAEYLTRLYTMALAIPDVEKVFWYSLVDTTDDESVSDSQFGLFEDDFTPKVSANAYKFVVEELTGQWFKDATLPGAAVLDSFTTSAGWHFAGTVCTNGSIDDHDSGKMTVRYTFTDTDNCYAPVTLGETLPVGTQVLQFKAKGDNSSTVLRVRVTDSMGETFQYSLGYLPKEWLYYNVQLNQPSTWWNGNHDGKLDQPLTFDSFVLDDADGLEESGLVQFDDVITSRRQNIYLYRFHANHKDKYAYWSAAKQHRLRILLAGAGRITERIWRYEDVKYKSGDGYYRLRARRAVTFLQTR
ncbi:MAG: endo-1,4-beta-xylanase [Candidatus Kerfeldbacteria bacterium]|nr:endo-1,4-beta-xylanase [Candidatus Kerfeldbacteria bacterium]